MPKFTAFAGIRNTLPAERLHVLPTKDDATTDLVEAVNVDLDNSGQVARRLGTALKIAGACHSIWAQGDTALFVRGAQLLRIYPDYSTEVLASGLTVQSTMAYAEVNGRVYWSNGFESGVIADGRSRSWGMDIPAAPGLSLVGGFVPAGQYQISVTFVRNDEQESGAALPSTITLADVGGLRVTWPAVSDPAIESARIYVSEPNGTTLYLAAEAPVDDLYTEVSSLGSAVPLNTLWQDKPPAAQALAYSGGRLWLGVGEFIFATTALGYEYVDLRDYVAVDGSRIRFLAGVEHGVFIGTANAVFFLSGDTLEDMSLKPISSKAGVAGSVVYVDGALASGNSDLAGRRCVMFASGEGVFLGQPTGEVANLTQDRYRFDAGEQGAAVFQMSDTLNHYLLFVQE